MGSPGLQEFDIKLIDTVEVIEDHQDLDRMDWTSLRDRISTSVRSLEKELKLDRRNISEPQFFMN